MTATLVTRFGPAHAVVLDTDGVITDSAGLHASAWKAAFDECLAAVGEERAFDAVEDYLQFVDGKSRWDGAAAFLRSRGIDLPTGSEADPPGTGTVSAVAARKEELFVASLQEHGVPAWPGTVRLLRALHEEAVPCAAVSASRHATDLLKAAGALELLDLVVDGSEAKRLHLPGKPDPALFTEAAHRLNVPPEQAVVIEDALAGVEAGRRGGFGLVIGVDRTHGSSSAADLHAHGADLVVEDLGELLADGSESTSGER